MGVWVDTDIAMGAPSGDVDDGFALAALLAGGADVVGVSSVFGNTSSARAAVCARRLIAQTSTQIPVVRGAERAGHDSDAAAAIAALPAGTRLLALGPLTNVAAALRRDPAVATRLTVALVGGNLSSRGRWPPLWPFEFNLAKDAAAAHAVFDSAVARRLHPLDDCRRLHIEARQLVALSTVSPLGRYLVRHSLRWLAYALVRYRSLGFPLWDLVPALDLLGALPHHVETRRLRLRGRGLLVKDERATPTEVIRMDAPATSLAAFTRMIAAAPARP